jgi:hypothetical protein
MHYVRDHFDTQEIGKVQLRGLDQEITIYRVIGKKREDPDGDFKEEKS